MSEIDLDPIERRALTYIVRQLESGKTCLCTDDFFPFVRSLDPDRHPLPILVLFEGLGLLSRFPPDRSSSAEKSLPGRVFPAYWRILGEAVRLQRELQGEQKGKREAAKNTEQLKERRAADQVGATTDPGESTVGLGPHDDASLALLRVFTNGLSDDRIKAATRLLIYGVLTANEKLTKIDALIPFPATASAEQLGEMLGVTKQAVLKTDWWIQNRRGEKDNEISRRHAGHKERAKRYETPDSRDDDTR
jgi:hypothetical protein